MTHAQIENMGDLVAAAVKTVIAADTGFPFPVYGPRQFSAMDINRVEVMVTGFARASDKMDIAANVGANYSHRRGSLWLTVASARTDQTSTDNHAVAVGRLRYLLSKPAQKLTTAVMSNLVVVEVMDNGESVGVDEATDLDLTTMRFQIEVFIPVSVYDAAT